MREIYIEKKVCMWAEKNGWFTRKLAWIGRVNAPDRFFAKGGRVVLIEFKATGKKATPNQRKEHERLRRAGVEVWVADSIDLGIDILSTDPP